MPDSTTISPEVANFVAALFQRTPGTDDTEPYVLEVNGIRVRITGTTLEVI